MTFAGQLLQSRVHLNHDVSYFVHFSRWLLQGRTLGTDLLDGNLPMVWALFMPSAALVQSNLLDEPSAVQLVFWAYFLISTALLISVLSRLETRTALLRSGWVVAFVLVATLGPGFSFGQREYACVLFGMPYLAAAVLRLQGGQILRRSIAICIGVLAGIGFALKPYFLADPGAGGVAAAGKARVAILARSRRESRVRPHRARVRRGGRSIIPDYLKFTIGLTRSTYWAYETGNFPVLLERYIHVVKPALYGALIALVTRTWSRQHTVMLLAGLGYSVSYFVQSKGFVYHAYPVLVCSVTFLGICIGQGLPRAWTEWQGSRNLLRLAVLSVAVLLALPPIKQAHDDVVRWYFTYNIAYGPVGQFRQAVIDSRQPFCPDPAVVFLRLHDPSIPRISDGLLYDRRVVGQVHGAVVHSSLRPPRRGDRPGSPGRGGPRC